ncbi:MAG TPA: DUF4410 domain-containing protein [Bryobacteraceae bacterium]|nr:DUF4410 domain-containing protein [Bryobacteraceae bacterium]
MRTLSTSIGLIFAALIACSASAQVPGTGRVQIKAVESYSGQPLTKPTGIVVYDFTATGDEVKLNSAMASRLRTRMSGNEGDKKNDLAHKVVENFSKSLIKDLEKTGLPVSRGVEGEAPPDNSLVVQGEFLRIEEGNRTRRMAVGLGAGASDVQANVKCLLKQAGNDVMFTHFQATSKSSRKPGAAETAGAGAAPEIAVAASGATEMKQNAEGDANRMAKAIAKQITKELAAQGWAK